MLEHFIEYLNKNIPPYLEVSENFLDGLIHSLNINFDSTIAMGQFTAWNDLKSTYEFIEYETGKQISWNCKFNKNIDDIIIEFNIFLEKLEEYRKIEAHQSS